MKSLFSFLVLLTLGSSLTVHAFPGLARFAPATLKDCHARGWELSRISTSASMIFVKNTDEECIAKFKIHPDDEKIHNGWRAELEDPLRLRPRSQATYEFSTLLPKSLNDPEVPSLVLAQWHDNKKPGVAALRPPLAIRLTNGRLRVTLFNQKIIDRQGVHGGGMVLASQPAVYDQWIQWRVRVYWALTNQGQVEVFMNGQQIAKYVGAIGYPDDLTSPYFKLGIYTTNSFKKPLEVYHTGYRRTYGEYFQCEDPPPHQGRYGCRDHGR